MVTTDVEGLKQRVEELETAVARLESDSRGHMQKIYELKGQLKELEKLELPKFVSSNVELLEEVKQATIRLHERVKALEKL